MTTIKERRFNVSLWTATDNFESDEFKPEEDLKRDKLICELRSCTMNFMMGSIPTASATPVLGTIINANKEESAQTTINELLKHAENRSPVIIALKVTQSFSSENNQPDITHWKFSKDKKQDRFGQYDNDYIDIFIGYLCPFTTEITATGAGIRLVIQHWLGALANSPLMTPAFTTATPMSLAIQYYTNGSDANAAVWLQNKDIKFSKNPNLWNAIKTLFLEVVGKYDSRGQEELFSKKIKNKIRYAIEHIDGSILNFKKSLVSLYSQIEKFLIDTDCRGYINTSAWNALISTYAPSFLFDIIPGIKKTRLIPISCTVNQKSLVILSEKDIFRITSTTLSPAQLSQIIEVASIADNTTGGMQGANECKTIAYYPPGSKKKEGFIQAIYYPAWLAKRAPTTVTSITQLNLLYAKDLTGAKRDVGAAQEEAAKAGEISSKFAYEFAKTNYLVQAYNRTSAHLVLPLRLDISLGTSVCCVIKSDQGASLNIYGIVTGIQFSISSAEATPVTQLTLSGIRTENLFRDDIENPQDPVGLYESRWGGKGIRLYD